MREVSSVGSVRLRHLVEADLEIARPGSVEEEQCTRELSIE